MGKTIDLRGQRFGRLVVIDKDIEISKKKKRSYWLCQCDCGNQKVIRHTNLTTGETISCGCYAKEISSLEHIVIANEELVDNALKCYKAIKQ